jgi:hypothetical protein
MDETAELWGVVGRLAKHRPAAAALLLADTLVDRLGVAENSRGRCLEELARDAVFERQSQASE